jgi:dUTP pyrophosphatase
VLIHLKKLYEDAQVPVRASDGSVGYDVYAYHVVGKENGSNGGRIREQELPFTLEAGKSVLIGIGVAFAVPFPVDCQVRPRSGLASKYNIELSNSPGTIDPDYRGEAGILLRNRGEVPFVVEKGMRVAQLVFTDVKIPRFKEVAELPPTERASGGFGSTGLTGVRLGEAAFLAEQLKWDRHFLRLAYSASGLSDCLRGATRNPDGSFVKDEENRYVGSCRRYGCVIVRDRNVVSQGFNSQNYECNERLGCVRERERIPSGTSNDRGCWHAEEAALQNLMRTGNSSSVGAILYVNSQPCHGCAKKIIGAGISAVVVPEEIVYADNSIADIEAAGIEVRWVNPQLQYLP